MKSLNNCKSGMSILGIVFFGFILVLVLSHYNINIQAVVESPQAQDNIHYVGGQTVNIWQQYLREPVLYFWYKIFIPLIWDAFTSNMERLKNGMPSDLQNSAPLLPH